MAKPRFFDRSMVLFLAVGVANTLVGMGLMYLFDYFGWGYWLSSSVAFFIGSVLSYALNKRFTFRSKDSVKDTVWRFALVIAVCYLIAFSAAQPATEFLLTRIWGQSDSDTVRKAAYLTGQVFYTALNYLGQRFFAFRARK